MRGSRVIFIVPGLFISANWIFNRWEWIARGSTLLMGSEGRRRWWNCQICLLPLTPFIKAVRRGEKRLVSCCTSLHLLLLLLLLLLSIAAGNPKDYSGLYTAPHRNAPHRSTRRSAYIWTRNWARRSIIPAFRFLANHRTSTHTHTHTALPIRRPTILTLYPVQGSTA